MDELMVGVISCSGEECLGGTISRLATRKMMEELRMGQIATICLPLFLAGGEEERGFAKVFPTIAVDGCSKCCAKRATEKYSGKVDESIVVSDIIGNEAALSKNVSTRSLKEEHYEMVNKVALEIDRIFDKIENADGKQ
jgi:uncharacterized metal-binding protein